MKQNSKLYKEAAIINKPNPALLIIVPQMITLMAFLSCNKIVEVNPPKTQLVQETVFADDATATSAVLGLYNLMNLDPLRMTYGGLSVYPGLSADEIYNVSNSSSYSAFSNNALLSTTSDVQSRFWSIAYQSIYQCNALLEGLAGSASLSPDVKSELTGEVMFVRAFYYFYLVNLFGNVPMPTNTDYEINAGLPRNSSEKIYELVISDLTEAKSFLPEQYVTSERVRPNKWAAEMLLARTYLYLKIWDKAEAEANDIINSNAYSLEPNLNNVFINSSNETIWQVHPTGYYYNSPDGYIYLPWDPSSKPDFGITNNLINDFEANDQRKLQWVGENIIDNVGYWYPNKYKIKYNSVSSEYNVVFRLAEAFLIRAEARANEEKLTESREDIDAIRLRAGLAATLANDKSSLLMAIEHERRIELFSEWGHRWFDLKRTNRADAVLTSIKGATWQVTDTLYPIPKSEMDLNKNLNQNAGY